MKAVNLLPSDQRGTAKVVAPAAVTKAPAGESFGAYAILGALALAVVAVSAMVLTKNTISDRKAELARTDQQVQAVAREAAALKPYADFKQLAAARVQTVQQLATSRFDWEQTLRDLSRALPRDTRLSGLTGNARGGGAITPGAVTPTASPTIEIAGCTSSQTSVAKLMSRLRAIRGVTRVTLKSSSKGTSSTTAAATTTSSGASLCKKKTAPTFGLTIHFERFGVPAISVPAGVGPTGPTGPTGPVTPAPGTTSTTAPATQGVSTP